MIGLGVRTWSRVWGYEFGPLCILLAYWDNLKNYSEMLGFGASFCFKGILGMMGCGINVPKP